MSVFVISDLHLALNVEKPMDIFGGAWTNHAERVKARWMDLVKPEDHVILPGDMSWGLKLEEAMDAALAALKKATPEESKPEETVPEETTPETTAEE